MIDTILDGDRIAPVKQRHTAKRSFERLRDEHGLAGGYTVVKADTMEPARQDVEQEAADELVGAGGEMVYGVLDAALDCFIANRIDFEQERIGRRRSGVRRRLGRTDR